MSRAAYGPAMGFDAQAARERIAAMLYRQHYAAPLGGHAIDKLRGLFGNALDYAVGDRPADFGLQRLTAAGHWVFVHGTSWTNKEWPESFWTILARRAVAAGKSVLLPWGNEKERQRAERIAAASGASVAVRQSLGAIAKVLASASAVVSVDSGLGHLAAAFGVPTVALFGPTDSAQPAAVAQPSPI
ncbi:MAG: hypothetical protein HC809_06665 [Gammaproteobacteria bacterium]|nr:hypothetical protein [Gammaproteobacteria bacterium]